VFVCQSCSFVTTYQFSIKRHVQTHLSDTTPQNEFVAEISSASQRGSVPEAVAVSPTGLNNEEIYHPLEANEALRDSDNSIRQYSPGPSLPIDVPENSDNYPRTKDGHS
jgi:hypothetical protein